MTDRVLYNADVRTMNPANARAEALAWMDGCVVAVGSRAEVERAAGAGVAGLDMGGATVLPGFVDAHHHPCLAALYGGVVRLSPPAVRDIAGLQRALAGAAKATPDGRWLVAMEWDEAALAERRPPTRQEVDDAVPSHPLLALHYSCHRAVANSRALELAGIGPNTPEPSGGTISRGSRRVPDGLLVERGMSRVESRARASLVAHDAEGFLARLHAHHRAMVAVGITRVVDAVVPLDLVVLYREAARRGLLTVPTIMMPVSTSGYLEEPWDVLEGPTTGHQEGEQLVVGPVKLVFDGAPACAMCLGWWQAAGVFVRTLGMTVSRGSLLPARTALSVSPRVGTKLRTGISIYRREEAEKIVAAAVQRGFAVATHAIGNAAVDVALHAYEAAGSELSRVGIPRIEHGSFLSRDLVARIKGVGAAVVAQPHFLTLPTYEAAASIPGVRNSPLRWLLDAGVKVAGSSDFPVAGFDPLDGIRSAVHRRTVRGVEYEPDQCIDLDEALAMYTRVAAEVSGCLRQCGTLEAGKRADVAVLDGPLSMATLEGSRVRATVVGGEVAFGELV